MATRLTTQRKTKTRHILSVTGIEEVIAELGRMVDAVDDEIENALSEAAKIVQDDAAQRAPFKRLGDNIEHDIEKLDRRHISARIGPNKSVFWGMFWEVGFHPWGGATFIPPHPYMRPALDSRRKEVEATIIENLKRAIERAI